MDGTPIRLLCRCGFRGEVVPERFASGAVNATCPACGNQTCKMPPAAFDDEPVELIDEDDDDDFDVIPF